MNATEIINYGGCMSEAIFTSVSQAIHVSFLVCSVEPRGKSAFRQILMQIIESVQLPSARLKAWYMELKGEPGTVNFDGLDPYEVRAQCAMVTQAVRDHLPGPERDVIWAKYSRQVEKAEGVKGLTRYVAPQLTIQNEEVIRALMYGFFDPRYRRPEMDGKKAGGLSYREISEFYGIHVKTLQRANRVIAKTSDILEEMAIQRLTPMFERDGLVECDDRMVRVA